MDEPVREPPTTARRDVVRGLLTSCFLPLLARAQDRPAARGSEELQPLLDRLMRVGFPGLAVAVVERGGAVEALGLGWADQARRIRMTPGHVFQIGSVTKMVTGYVLARLVTDGVVRLRDPVQDHLPAGRVVPRDPRGAVVTLQHLATHTAGLPAYPPNVRKPMRGYTVAELYEGLARTRLDPVGASFNYSSFGYGLLGQALEHAGGHDFAALLERHVTRPAGLSSTGLSPAAGALVAVPYAEHDPSEASEGWQMGALAPAGQIYSSAADLAAWLRYELAAVPASAAALARAPLVSTGADARKRYALGRFVDGTIQEGDDVVWHGGNVDSYTSGVMYSVRHGVGLVLLANWGAGPNGEFGDALYDLFRKAVAGRGRG
jgi:D-alanyl-D-alanine-carboxypeptidase/D-alanyl-D-alanine-endopeptidase